MQAQRCVEPSGTNQACGLAYYLRFTIYDLRFAVCGRVSRIEIETSLEAKKVPPRDLPASRCVAVPFSSQTNSGFQAGGHRGAAIPVPMPNTEVKGAIAEGSVGPAHARVGRRRPFFYLRFTIYDLRLHCSIVAIRPFAQLERLRVEGVRYLRFAIYDLRFTIYHLRFTIYDLRLHCSIAAIRAIP